MSRKERINLTHRQCGAAAVEFALVAGLLFAMLLAVIEMGRLMWTFNAAVEATRLGARMAVVCSKGSETDSLIKTRMIGRLPELTPANINIEYINDAGLPSSCPGTNCRAVSVSLNNYQHTAIVPFGLLLYLSGQKPDTDFMTIPMPHFSTTLRREAMNGTAADNAACK